MRFANTFLFQPGDLLTDNNQNIWILILEDKGMGNVLCKTSHRGKQLLHAGALKMQCDEGYLTHYVVKR